MRIIALPLTSAVRGPGHTVEPSPLVYYHFQMPPKTETRRGGWVDWATGKAASVWAQFGKAPEGSWKVRLWSCLRLSHQGSRADCGPVDSIRKPVQVLYVRGEVGRPRRF